MIDYRTSDYIAFQEASDDYGGDEDEEKGCPSGPGRMKRRPVCKCRQGAERVSPACTLATGNSYSSRTRGLAST